MAIAAKTCSLILFKNPNTGKNEIYSCGVQKDNDSDNEWNWEWEIEDESVFL
jgi:hypothetical protein